MIKQKKRLGQVFLKNHVVILDILRFADIQEKDNVLEIGPGKGALTKELLKRKTNLIVVEKDPEWANYLKEKYPELKIHIDDVRDIYSKVIKEFKKSFKLVANIPYYLTSFLIQLIVTNKERPKVCILMIQKEVAIRITERDKKSSLLSVITNFYADIKYLKTVPKADFKPIPKVDSALIEIIPKKYNKNIEENFLKIVKQGFLHKRKQLFKNLKQIIKEDNLQEIFSNLNILLDIRAESLSTQTWIEITKQAKLL